MEEGRTVEGDDQDVFFVMLLFDARIVPRIAEPAPILSFVIMGLTVPASLQLAVTAAILIALQLPLIRGVS